MHATALRVLALSKLSPDSKQKMEKEELDEEELQELEEELNRIHLDIRDCFAELRDLESEAKEQVWNKRGIKFI